MDFVDGEAEASTDVLVPSSQPASGSRPRKRRRINQDGDDEQSSTYTEEGEYDLPTPGEGDEKENKKSKYEERIYVPAGDRQPDTFVTQLTQQYSSPSRIRGPRWMKPRKGHSPSPSPAISTSATTRPMQPISVVEDEFDVDLDDLDLLAAFTSNSDGVDTISARQSTVNLAKQPVLPMTGNRAHTSTTARQALQKSSSFRQTTLHGINTTQQEPPRTQTQSKAHNWPLANRVEPPTHHEIDRDSMATWVYPTNLGRIRDYQYNIVYKSLFNNILVALPTGLGKTFIAATVMLNWFRWTKTAQIVFVAPTKPLVAQQINACFNIVGIPRSQTIMLTGEVPPAIRAEEWKEKRVFFMTPQTLTNDLKHGYCDPKRIVLVVIDEAHKATGGYAYVEVVHFLRRFSSSFRVLALTATPGKNVEKVQEVIDGLGIARVEIRTEESLDIRSFVHSRNVEVEIFDNSEEMVMALELLGATLQPLLNKLHTQGAAWGRDPTRITLFGLKTAWEKWQASEAGRKAPMPVKGMIRSISSTLMSLAHNIELLKYHGIGPFYHKMKLFVQEASAKAKYTKQIIDDSNFKTLMNRLALWTNDPDFEGHPKLSYLKTVVLNHFLNAGEGNAEPEAGPTNTRIMVFAHYRDSAEEIVRVLNRQPLIQAHVFVGQSGSKSGSEGMNQKKQLEIIQKFKAGTYNTIVATSIGEEGLDIGEVDLIVCYDCSKSPIRMLQRMGRTGRKRAGNIVLLVMRGKEEQDFRESEDNYQKMQEKIASGKEFNFHDEQSPRIVPKEIEPQVDKRVIEIPVENTQPGSVDPIRRRAKNLKKPPKKFHMPDGVETGFTFLGDGKKSKGQAKQTGSKARKSQNEDTVAALPSLTDVLLSEKEEMQLEDRYARLAGNEDEYIQQVRYDAFPEQQRRLGKSGAIKHSKKTKKFVKAYKAMHTPGREWDRPSDVEEVTGGNLPLDDVEEEIVTVRKAVTNGPKTKTKSKTSKPAKAKRTSEARSFTEFDSHNIGPTSDGLATSSIGQYDDMDSFIDDDDAEDLLDSLSRSKQNKTNTTSTELAPRLALPSSPRSLSATEPPVTKRTKSVHRAKEDSDMDDTDDELPDLEELISSKKRKQVNKPVEKDGVSSPIRARVAKKSNKGTSRARRVIDDDEEDDE